MNTTEMIKDIIRKQLDDIIYCLVLRSGKIEKDDSRSIEINKNVIAAFNAVIRENPYQGDDSIGIRYEIYEYDGFYKIYISLVKM